MSTEMLLLAVLASMTVVAFMIAINSRGRWRATLSSLLAICMLGGTVWVFTLQYSVTFKAEGDQQRLKLDDLLGGKDRAAKREAAENTALACSLVARANTFAGALINERMHDPSASHDQLVARASGTEQRFEALQSEIAAKKQAFEKHPEAAELLGRAMTELKAACHLYRSYYYSENTDAEVSTERLLKQKARNARDTLAKAERAIGAK